MWRHVRNYVCIPYGHPGLCWIDHLTIGRPCMTCLFFLFSTSVTSLLHVIKIYGDGYAKSLVYQSCTCQSESKCFVVPIRYLSGLSVLVCYACTCPNKRAHDHAPTTANSKNVWLRTGRVQDNSNAVCLGYTHFLTFTAHLLVIRAPR